MNKLDDILEKLQTQQPVLKDEDAFIDSIMDALPDLPEEEVTHTPPFIIAMRTCTSLAASVLIGWFIFLNAGAVAAKEETISRHEYSSSVASSFADLNEGTTPQEVMKRYSEKKSMNINKLIAIYNEN